MQKCIIANNEIRIRNYQVIQLVGKERKNNCNELLLVVIRILRYALAANLVILSKDVSLNPDPTGPSLRSSFSSFSSFNDESSLDDSRFSSLFVSPNDTRRGSRILKWGVNFL